MPDYYDDINNYLEGNAVKLLQAFNLNTEKNNSINKTFFDINVNEKLFDFQWSSSFEIYGDLRVDIISSYITDHQERIVFNQVKTNIESFVGDIINYLKDYLVIQKKGKLFDLNLYGLIYYIYNKKIDVSLGIEAFKNNPPDKIILIKRIELLEYINSNFNKLVHNDMFKLNYKKFGNTGSGDFHGSAFICIKWNDLKNEKFVFELNCKELLKKIDLP